MDALPFISVGLSVCLATFAAGCQSGREPMTKGSAPTVAANFALAPEAFDGDVFDVETPTFHSDEECRIFSSPPSCVCERTTPIVRAISWLPIRIVTPYRVQVL